VFLRTRPQKAENTDFIGGCRKLRQCLDKLFWSGNRGLVCVRRGNGVHAEKGATAFAWARKIEAKGEAGSRMEATCRRD
jgi:hypothetical protein